jgi:hypothetical protein
MTLFRKTKIFVFSMSALFTSASFGAIYEVPVAQNLRPYAGFNIASPSVRRLQSARGPVTVLRYNLPPELVGSNGPSIEMGTGNFEAPQFHLHGPQGDADCIRSRSLANGDSVACNVRFKNLNVQPESVKAFLQNRSTSAAEFQKRLQVAAEFFSDPVGILRY